MEEKKTSPSRQEIKSLCLLLLFSFLTAGIIAAYLIVYYGPTGRYSGKNTALAPDVLDQLNYADIRTGSPFKMLFDTIQFTFYDKKLGKSSSMHIDMEAYSKFYLTISSDESLDELQVPPTLFEKSTANITIYTKPEKALKGEDGRRVFQRIEFSQDGNHYRIELIGDNESVWAYFKHPQILESAIKIFIP